MSGNNLIIGLPSSGRRSSSNSSSSPADRRAPSAGQVGPVYPWPPPNHLRRQQPNPPSNSALHRRANRSTRPTAPPTAERRNAGATGAHLPPTDTIHRSLISRHRWRCATASPRSAARSTARPGFRSCRCSDGWQADQNATALYPQQSCSKLWVAITAMDAVDRGRVSLNDRVTLGRDDLTLFHQPIARQDPRRRPHHHARRAAVHRDHRERQYRQRQVDALDRRAARRCAT